MSFINYSNAPYLLTAVFTIFMLIGFVAYISKKKKQKTEEEKFLEQLKYVTGEQQDYTEEEKTTIITKWNKYWGRLLIQSDIAPETKTDAQLGITVMFSITMSYLIITILTRNPGIAMIPISLVLLFLVSIANKRITQKSKIFEEQIPAFLSTLKSNIQAHESPNSALINAIDNTVDPLYSELKIVKAYSETGTFLYALKMLRQSTQNDSLRFLCSCIELASDVGTNLEDQITTIEKMLEAKRELNRKLEKAIAHNTPLLYAATTLIPFVLMYMYAMNEQVRQFWFIHPISWIVFFFVVVLFGSAVMFTKRMIDNVSKF